MTKLEVIVGNKPTAELSPFQRFRQMNPALCAELKLHELNHHQRALLSRYLAETDLASAIEDADVITALADPEDPIRDFERMDPAPRGRWHRLLARLGFRSESDRLARDAVKRRIGLIQRVIRHACRLHE